MNTTLLPDRRRDPVEHDPIEVLIKEARRRTRRRRVLWGVVIAITAAGLVAYVASGNPPPAENANLQPQPEPRASVAPIAFNGDATAIVGSWAQGRVGWVLAYGDGRVIWYPDFNATATDEIPGYAVRYSLIERSLSPLGRDLVASGALPLEELLRGDGHVHLRDDLWADPTAHGHEPAKFAACYGVDPRISTTPAAAVSVLPQPVQPLLTGKEHTYTGTPVSGVIRSLWTECSELTADEALTVGQVLMFAGAVIPQDRRVWRESPSAITDVGDLGLLIYPFGPDRAAFVRFSPILPHGDYVGWTS
jgi:hypothetical protein